MAQQESIELLACFTLSRLGILPGAGEISHGFIFALWDVDRSQLARPVKSGQLVGIASVIFDSVSALLWYQGRCGDHALDILLFQRAINPISTGTGLIDKVRLAAAGHQFSYNFVERGQVGINYAVRPHLAIALVGECNGNGFFMNIKPDIRDKLSHDLPPWLWLCSEFISVPRLTHVCKGQIIFYPSS